MKEKLKQILPERSLILYRYLRKIKKKKINSPRNKIVNLIPRNSYKGKRVFIIGNAPSLRHHDLTLLKDEYVVCVNKGYLLKDRGLNHITFYGLSDFGVVEEYGQDIPLGIADHLCIFGPIDWQKPICKKISYFAMYTEYAKRKYMSAGFFQHDINQPVAHSKTVVLQMLQVVAYAGFSEVYFIGVDNDFSGSNMHFYKDSDIEKKRINNWGIDPCIDIELAFKEAHDHLISRGVRLYNAGYGGKLNSLPRVSYEGLFA